MQKQPKKPNNIQAGKKNEINPFIEVRGPGDTHYKFDLKNVQTIIGRLQDVNEIALARLPLFKKTCQYSMGYDYRHYQHPSSFV